MLGMEFLEVIIGLLFVYLLLSLLTGIIVEIISGTFSFRGRFLAKAIAHFVDDDKNQLSKIFFEHPIFQKVRPPSRFKWFEKFKYPSYLAKYPSYLAKEGFSRILFDSLLNSKPKNNFQVKPVTFERLKKSVKQDLSEGDTQQMLLTLIYEAEQAENKLEKFKEVIENWYETLMDRVEGWYKRRVQLSLFMFGLTIAILFNADTFQIAYKLSIDPIQRQQLVELADTFSERINKEGLQKYYDMSVEQKMDSAFVAELKAFSGTDSAQALKLYYNALQLHDVLQKDIPAVKSVLGLGRVTDIKIPDIIKGFWPVIGWILLKLLGFTITALAISLGAPFWFDLLNKVMHIRSSGKVPENNSTSLIT